MIAFYYRFWNRMILLSSVIFATSFNYNLAIRIIHSPSSAGDDISNAKSDYPRQISLQSDYSGPTYADKNDRIRDHHLSQSILATRQNEQHNADDNMIASLSSSASSSPLSEPPSFGRSILAPSSLPFSSSSSPSLTQADLNGLSSHNKKYWNPIDYYLRTRHYHSTSIPSCSNLRNMWYQAINRQNHARALSSILTNKIPQNPYSYNHLPEALIPLIEDGSIIDHHPSVEEMIFGSLQDRPSEERSGSLETDNSEHQANAYNNILRQLQQSKDINRLNTIEHFVDQPTPTNNHRLSLFDDNDDDEGRRHVTKYGTIVDRPYKSMSDIIKSYNDYNSHDGGSMTITTTKTTTSTTSKKNNSNSDIANNITTTTNNSNSNNISDDRISNKPMAIKTGFGSMILDGDDGTDGDDEEIGANRPLTDIHTYAGRWHNIPIMIRRNNRRF